MQERDIRRLTHVLALFEAAALLRLLYSLFFTAALAAPRAPLFTSSVARVLQAALPVLSFSVALHAAVYLFRLQTPQPRRFVRVVLLASIVPSLGVHLLFCLHTCLRLYFDSNILSRGPVLESLHWILRASTIALFLSGYIAAVSLTRQVRTVAPATLRALFLVGLAITIVQYLALVGLRILPTTENLSVLRHALLQLLTFYPACSALWLIWLVIVLHRSRGRARTTGRCRECGYLLVALRSERCPECGCTITTEVVA